MSLKSTLFWVGLGGGLIALLVKQDRRRAATRAPETLPADPEIAAALDLEALDLDVLDLDRPTSFDAVELSAHDLGAMYGQSTPRATDRSHLDDDVAMQEGQNWLEALETDAIEDGAQAELPLDVIDDAEVDHSSLDMGGRDDVPVADRGAGGPGGI